MSSYELGRGAESPSRVGKQGKKEGAKLAEAYTHSLDTIPGATVSLALFVLGCLVGAVYVSSKVASSAWIESGVVSSLNRGFASACAAAGALAGWGCVGTTLAAVGTSARTADAERERSPAG